MDTPDPDSPRRRTIASRRWWVLFVALLLVVALVGVWTFTRSPNGGVPGAGPAQATPSPTPSIPEIARREVWRSDTKASGVFALNTATAQPKLAAPQTVPYVVKVEDTTTVKPDEAAAEVQRILDDPKGWASYGKRNFTLVTDEKAAKMTVWIVAPDTADKLCAPLDTGGKWDCRNGRNVVLNSDRWRFMTPTYDDLGLYRAYLVNHEVGHFLGQGHASCPGKGKPAPVMMQQSIDIGGCVPNAWPRTAD